MLGVCILSARVLDEIMFVPVLMYCSESMIWKEKERLRIRAVPQKFVGCQENRQSAECTDKGVVQSDEEIDEGVLRWFGHMERIDW